MRVLIFGDSITQGFWDTQGGWVQRLRQPYDVRQVQDLTSEQPTFFNLGVSGNSADDLVKRMPDEIAARANGEKLAIVISIGVNDARLHGDQEISNIADYTKNLETILAIAQKFTDRVLFVGLTPCNEAMTNPVGWNDTRYNNARIGEFNAALQEFCRAHAVPFVDIFSQFEKNANDLLADGLHPNDAGHDLIASLVRPELEKIL